MPGHGPVSVLELAVHARGLATGHLWPAMAGLAPEYCTVAPPHFSAELCSCTAELGQLLKGAACEHLATHLQSGSPGYSRGQT